MKLTKEVLSDYFQLFIGAILCCVGINAFIVPVHLYNGGAIGIAQIIRTLLNLNTTIDVSGIINLLINIPLFLLAYKGVSRKFFVRTVFSVAIQTVLFSIIVVNEPIISDVLSACLIGGIVSGIGVGMNLKAGGSCGGIDIVAVYFASKSKNGSVGLASGAINGLIYLFCAILFDLPTAIYSIIYAFIFALVIDKIHYQNICVSIMIFTKKDHVEDYIMHHMGRGVTRWEGEGAYTHEDTHILYTLVSKYEINEVRKAILEVDPNAFIIINEGLNVTGNYEKRL